MDIGAELTLQIARLVQQRVATTRSPLHWSFWPQGSCGSWEEARTLLAAARKPVLVAPLIEPGALGVFPLDQFPETERHSLAAQFTNQLEYYVEKLGRLGLAEGDSLRFEPAAPECVLSVAKFMQWARDYAIGVGVSIASSPDPRVGRIIVRPPGGGGPPLGA